MANRVSSRTRKARSFPNYILLSNEQHDQTEVVIKNNKEPKSNQRNSRKFTTKAENKSPAAAAGSKQQITNASGSLNCSKKRKSDDLEQKTSGQEINKPTDPNNSELQVTPQHNLNAQNPNTGHLNKKVADSTAITEGQVPIESKLALDIIQAEDSAKISNGNSIKQGAITIKEDVLISAPKMYSQNGMSNITKQSHPLSVESSDILEKIKEVLAKSEQQDKPKIIYVTPEQITSFNNTFMEQKHDNGRQNCIGPVHTPCSCNKCYEYYTSRQHPSHPYSEVASYHGNQGLQHHSRNNFQNSVRYEQQQRIPYYNNATSLNRSVYNGHQSQMIAKINKEWAEKINTKNKIIKSLMDENRKLKGKFNALEHPSLGHRKHFTTRY